MGQADSDLRKRTTKSRSARQKAPRFNDILFVQYELDKDQQKACKDHEITTDQLFDECLALISDGYRISLQFDSYGECYGCFMHTRDEHHHNFGFMLTGRGSTPAKALKQLIYKHRVCLDGDWAGFVERRGGGAIDD